MANDVNHVILIGRLTRDLGNDDRSFGYVGNGQARANISIAVNRSRKEGDEWKDEVSYFDVTIWGKTAENLKPYLTKGKQVCVEGSLRQDRWEKDGQKFSKVVINANNVQLLGGKADGTGSSAGGAAPSFQPRTTFQNSSSSMPDYSNDYGSAGNDFPEDIPF
ncbi:MAG: single-stranded DNA-binding protein [Treponema sp.]|nr:single-stranded DNA-binding protein [Treponema sp.]